MQLFRRQLDRQQVRVRVIRQDEKVGIEETLGNPSLGIPGAGFYFTGEVGWVLLPERLELGLAAPVVLHELIHATDTEYQASYLAYLKLEAEYRQRVQGALVRTQSQGLNQRGIPLFTSTVDRSELQVVRNLRVTLDRMTAHRTLRSEACAYQAQWKWIQKQIQVDPGYEGYLKEAAKRGWQISEPKSLEEIAKAYGINPKWISTFEKVSFEEFDGLER